MTRDEAERFPSTIKWIRDLEQHGVPTLNSWFDVTFRDLDFMAVLDVSQAIQGGVYELGRWQDLPATYRRIAGELRLAEAEASRVKEPADLHSRRIKCRECRDGGLVMCWDVATMSAMRRYLQGGPAVTRWYVCGVACGCQAGNRFGVTAVQRGKSIETVEHCRYDDARWVRLTGDEAVDRQALADWAATYRPANYSDFGEYSTHDSTEEQMSAF